jgi:uncharacterized protein YndB with AHSA1/START domain
MASWRQQAVIDAPVEVVWGLVGDPNRYPEWAGEVVAVTGLASIDKGAEFRRVSKGPLGKSETTFAIDELEELKEIKLRCTESGYYSRWLLTEAQGATFADVEIGMEPTAIQYRLLAATVMGKRWNRKIVQEAIDGLQTALARERSGG